MIKPVVSKADITQRRRRASKACISCRKRKTKCDYDKVNSRCVRCQEEDLPCVISEIEKRGGYGNVLAGKEKRERAFNQQLLHNGTHTNGGGREAVEHDNIPEGVGIADGTGSPNPDDSVLKNDFYNPSEAIDILYYASQSNRHHAIGSLRSRSDFRGDKWYRPSSDSSCDYGQLSNRRIPIHESAIVLDGILTAEEASRLAGFFFAKIAPFYASYLPPEYQELARISAEPALLAVVCTLGARCLNEVAFSDLHQRLWNYCKHTVSDYLWECPPHQIRSLVFAVLAIAEWFPGAFLIPNISPPGESLRRHTRICWPLVGQTVRLAKYVGLLKNDIQATITLYFTDHLLACRLGQQPMLNSIDDASEEFPESLVQRCTPIDRARLDIVKLLHMTSRALYRSRSETRKLISSGQYIVVLDLIYQLSNKWEADYHAIVEGETWSDRTTMFEFNHFKLYVFSIALIPWQDSSTSTKLIDFDRCEKFLRISVDAAKAVIEHESSTDLPVELKYSPIQWITRLLHASVFLAKALLLGNVFVTPDDKQDIVDLLDAAAKTLAQLPPEDQRIFSRPLEKICQRFSKPVPTSTASTASSVSDFCTDDNALEFLLDQDFLGHMLAEESPFGDVFGSVPT